MSDTFWAGLVGGVAGIVTGGISSVVAPWANWQIDERRQKMANKRDLILRWRDMLASTLKHCRENKGEGYYWLRIQRHPTFTSLRPQLASESYEKMKTINDTEECHMYLVRKVGEIEKKWKLV